MNTLNILFEILTINKQHKLDIDSLKRYYKDMYSEGLDRYFNFFEQENVGFFTQNPDLFNDINLNFQIPNKIANSIIEISDKSDFDLENLIWQLDKLGCNSVEIRYLKNMSILSIQESLNKFNDSKIKCFNLVLMLNTNLNFEALNLLLSDVRRINRIVVIGSDKINITNTYASKRIKIVDKNEYEHSHSSKVTFINNLTSFCEAQDFNLALNKKLCIDEEGKIKNYINHSKVFGHINKINIAEIIYDNDFQFIWNLSNDKIEICKVCQYRYICFSCSDIYSVEEVYYKTSTCTFNPYQNTWTNKL